MSNKCYRVDYNGNHDCDYIWCADDDSAIKMAFEIAKQGVEYSDIGHCVLDVSQITEVDTESECYNDKRVIWY